MPSFSERNGLARTKIIQVESLDLETRNLLFNVIKRTFLQPSSKNKFFKKISDFANDIEFGFHKKPNINALFDNDEFVLYQFNYIQTQEWFKVLELIEFMSGLLGPGAVFLDALVFEMSINSVFESERCGYRLVGGKVAPIIHQAEIGSVESSMAHRDKFGPVAQHITSALDLYAKKPNPDYRNSMKESISAVEAAAKIITGDANATLGKALKEIEKSQALHPSLKEGFLKIYGYTNDNSGIRHALKDKSTADEADARFMLVSCSAFSNYLISKFGL